MHDLIPRPPRLPEARVSNRALRQAHRLAARVRDGSYWLRWLSARAGALSIAALCLLVVVGFLAFSVTVTKVALGGAARLRAGATIWSLVAWFASYRLAVGLLPFAWDSARMAAGLQVDLLDPDHAPVRDARLRIVRVHGRRAGVVDVMIDTHELDPGDQVEVALSLSEDSLEGPLLADHPAFRGAGGMFVARELSAPVGEDDSMEMFVSVVFPVRALVFPKEATVLRGVGTLELAVGERAVGTFEFPWEFAVVESDRQTLQARRPRAPVAAATPEEMAVLAHEVAGAGQCMVCGDELAATEAMVRCGVCETPHHEECWAYVGKCTTYACGGSAMRIPGPPPS